MEDPKLKDKAIGNELDVEAVMELPMLISLPWLGHEGENGGNTLRSEERVKETVQG